MQARRWLQRGLLLAAAVPLIAACEFSGPQSALDPAGPIALAQRDLFMWTYWLSWVVMIGVFGALGYALWRFRARSGKDAHDPDAMPHQTHGNTRLEIVWTLIPVVLVVLVAVPTVRTIFATEQRIVPTSDDTVVHATGYQWWFKFEYPELGITTANELIIPVGERIVIDLDAADVLHSFWVPNLAGKRDMIPNNDNQIWFSADAPGVYFGQCAELCLGAHAYMRFRVIAMERPEYEQWVAAFQGAAEAQLTQQADPLVAQGKQLMAQKGCVGCHVVDGFYPDVAVGNPDFPDLTNFGLRTTLGAAIVENTPENLAAWLRDPQALKPGNRMPTLWSAADPNRDEEIEAIVAYLHSLGRDPATSASLTLGGLHGGR